MIKQIAFIVLDYFSETKLEAIYDEKNNPFFCQQIFSTWVEGYTFIYFKEEKKSDNYVLINCYSDKGIVFPIKINCLDRKFEFEIRGKKLAGGVSHYYEGIDCIYLDYLGERSRFVT